MSKPTIYPYHKAPRSRRQEALPRRKTHEFNLSKLLPENHPLSSIKLNLKGLSPKGARKFLTRFIENADIDNPRVVETGYEEVFEKVGPIFVEDGVKHQNHFCNLVFPQILKAAIEAGMSRSEIIEFFNNIDLQMLSFRFLYTTLVRALEDGLNLVQIARLLKFAIEERGWDVDQSANYILDALNRIDELPTKFIGDNLFDQVLMRLKPLPSGLQVESISQKEILRIIAQGLLLLPSHTTYGKDLKGSSVAEPIPTFELAEYPGIPFPGVSFNFVLEFLRTSQPFQISAVGDVNGVHPLFESNVKTYWGNVYERREFLGGLDLLKQVGLLREDVPNLFIQDKFSGFVGLDQNRRVMAFPLMLVPGKKYLYHGFGDNLFSRGSGNSNIIAFDSIFQKIGLYGPSLYSTISMSSDPLHSRRFGSVLLEISIDKLIEEKVIELNRFRSLIGKASRGEYYHKDDEFYVFTPQGEMFHFTIDDPNNSKIEQVPITVYPGNEGSGFFSMRSLMETNWDAFGILNRGKHVMGIPQELYEEIDAQLSEGRSLSGSQRRKIGYGNGVYNDDELEIAAGFNPRFLPMAAVETVFMPEALFDQLLQRNSVRIVDSQKLLPTPGGNKSVITYPQDIIEVLCERQLERLA